MAHAVLDGNGVAQVFPIWVDSAYRVAATVAPGSTPTSVIQIKGADDIVVRIKRIALSLVGDGTNAQAVVASLNRRSTAASGGTAVTPTVGKHDTDDGAASAVVTHYTAFPTAGTLVALIGREQLNVIAAGGRSQAIWEFANRFDKPLTLRSASEFITIDLSAALATGGVLTYEIEWEESTT